MDGWAPGARQGHCAGTIGGTMFVFGGMEAGKRTNSTLSFDIESSKWQRRKVSGEVPAPRCYAASWTSGSKFYIHGGEAEGSSQALDHTRLDASTGRPTEVSHDTSLTHTDVFRMVNDRVRVKRRCLDDVCCFDTQKNQWTHITTSLAPLARKGHTLTRTSSNGKPVMVMLGGAPSGSTELCPMSPFVLSADDRELQSGRAMWTTPDVGSELPTARFGHSCTPSR
jgi:N-acetylneuraminic acid mutarotase